VSDQICDPYQSLEATTKKAFRMYSTGAFTRKNYSSKLLKLLLRKGKVTTWEGGDTQCTKWHRTCSCCDFFTNVNNGLNCSL